jgi:hypothetical protein
MMETKFEDTKGLDKQKQKKLGLEVGVREVTIGNWSQYGAKLGK